MTTETGVKLTPKQQRVLDLLNEGLPLGEVAKRLKISRQGTYGHVRNIRLLGVSIPGEGNGSTPAAPPAAAPEPVVRSADAPIDPAIALETNLAHGAARMQEIENEVATLRAQIDDLEREHGHIEERQGKFRAALDALA